MNPLIRTPGTPRPQAVFLFDLVQDISVLRPIIRVLATETRLDLLLLISHKLEHRDRTGVWMAELEELASLVHARIARFDSPLSACGQIQGRSGLIFSASETDLVAHEVNHEVFLAAPSSYVRITVQHGHECVGFSQNQEQTIAHGEQIRFAADIICGWAPAAAMKHLCSSERAKYFELGPPMSLDRPHRARLSHRAGSTGLICENLHSVRMRTSGNLQTHYLDTIREFAAIQAISGRTVALRPHPGGQFVIKNKVALPSNVTLANAAMYKTDLKQFAYGISAPSSVIVDMVMAGIPTAVWRDPDNIIDTSGYAGLVQISSVADWVDFAEAAVSDPEPILARQREFLARNALDVRPEQIRERLLNLVEGATFPLRGSRSLRRPPRVLLIANGVVPTLHISFIKPLAPLVDAGLLETKVLTEASIRATVAAQTDIDRVTKQPSAFEEISSFAPDIAVFCRYSGPAAQDIVEQLRAAQVPVLFHIDDDLLNVPPEVGPKHIEHNRIERTSTVRYLLQNADLVYCSTRRLQDKLYAEGFVERLGFGEIYCSGEIVVPAERLPVRTIGFMGNDKTPELTDLVPAIAELLDRNPQVRFELFGSMAMPEELLRFGDRVMAIGRIGNYEEFVAKFRNLRWEIGLAPLHRTSFNLAKADTKWVDYTSIGAAVVASYGVAYDECCSDGCGLLAHDHDEWVASVQSLIDEPDERLGLVIAAQEKLRTSYSIQRLSGQVLSMFDRASQSAAAAARGSVTQDHAPTST
ncbi:glycosyltransferase involved in cell wall biosynthesis [Sphingobium sp. B2D3A]|uniref:glycosyltransferase family protein n=1 Tax=unclassified Sphingobium TaxID=2611147 RepID=UPI0022240677|nr:MULTISPECIES: glycosyltransferase [unclassified Sphingobium]MCW2338507.1 glycosyltransferase involved in cell wall biosynthesis [Sphingobium sp. B2D3A]MCW2384965.1 glycosyltransferase involved in cell wall biosynthesis [Sphingobium sp. B2D3D]